MRTKFAVLTSLLIALISIFIYTYFPQELEAKAREAIAERARNVGVMMAYNISLALREEDRPTVCKAVMTAKRDPELEYMMVVDTSGNVIASHNASRALEVQYDHEVDLAERISADDKTLQCVQPIIVRDTLLGRVYVGLSLKEMEREVSRSRSTIAAVSAAISILGILCTIVLSNIIARPLVRMADAVNLIARGDWKQRVPLESRDEVGRLAKAFNTMVDNLAGAYDELLLEKTRFQQLFENAPVGILLADDNERIIHANSVFQNMFGYSLAELQGRTINETIVPPHLRNEGNELSHRVLMGEPIQAESVRSTKDGRTLHVNIYGVPIRMNERGVGVFGMYVDITQRKQAEAELARLAHAVRSVSEGIIITDVDDNIMFTNKAILKMYGYTEEELIGKPVTILRAPAQADVPVREATLEGGWQGELLNCRKDGTVFPIFLSTSVVRDDAGNIIALVGVTTDITEKKQAEEQRARLMRDLETMNKELNDFAYIVSHDLKAPLRAIGTLANWLATDYGDKLGNDGKELLSVLLGRTKRMHDLIEGVLRYSRIGRTREEMKQVNLDTLVAEIVEMIAPPPSVEVKIHHPLPIITAEPTRIQQIFQNLISNAVKFMDKPRGLIEIGCTRENGHWTFRVADNGPGIEERHFKKIFQIFQTLAPRDEYESTGIGLTIVKKIVETYGGQIWVESQVGVGTTFYFTLPAEQAN